MVSFNFSFQPGMTLQQMIGFEMAGRIWGTYLTDNATINLHVGTAGLAANLLGGSLPGFKTGQDYSNFRSKYIADISSTDDQAVSQTMVLSDYQRQNFNLSGWDPAYSADRVFIHTYDMYLDSTLTSQGSTTWFNDLSNGKVLTKNGVTYGRWGSLVPSNQLSLTRANAKALGIDVSTGSSLDGYIVLSNLANNPGLSWNYDFTRSSTMPSNTLDFLSTALHEIGHVLGFVSGVDRPNLPSPFFNRSDSPDGSIEKIWSTATYNNYWQSEFERSKRTTPLDLVRYSTESVNGSSRGFQDVSMGSYYGNMFLSLDGVNSLGNLAEGKDVTLAGDGSQASHWKEETTSLGLMDSYMKLAERASLATRDLRAFDILGWNRNSSASLNYSTLLYQAKQSLANRLGRTVSWLDAYPALAADWLDQDRLTDVNLMLSDSGGIYEGKTNSGSGGSWQELFSLLNEQGLLDSIEDTHAEPAKATVRNDLLTGSTKDDELSGLRGNDQVIGFKGNDSLRGNKGEDTLFGSLGQDVLIGGKGNDSLIGGAGADIFAVQRYGFDVVEDFTDGEDKLLLLGGLQFEQLGIEQKGQDTLISYEGNSLMLLKNLDKTSLSSADIVYSM